MEYYNGFKLDSTIYFINLDQNTQKIEQVMRYVLYMLTGHDYGVTNLDDFWSTTYYINIRYYRYKENIFNKNQRVIK